MSEILVKMDDVIWLVGTQVHEGTIYRWNTDAGGKKRLPPYDVVRRSTKWWRLSTILEWAERVGIELDASVLEGIKKEQAGMS